MPRQECSSSEKRRAPSERSCTRSSVHFAPMISAQAATEQVASWTGFIVRVVTAWIVLPAADSVPRGRVVQPAAAHQRRDDLELAQLFRRAGDRVAVEHDEVGEHARQEAAAAALVARE